MSSITAKNRWFTLDEKCLHQQRLFWVCLITPFIIGAIIGLPVWIKYDFALNYEAYDFFMQISKLPLSIMALSPIATAFVVNAHKTIQTSKQITLLTRKNTQDEFYSHYKYMTESILSLSETLYVTHHKNSAQISLTSGGKVNRPENSDKISFSCSNPQFLYNNVFEKCSPEMGVSFYRTTFIPDLFKEKVIKLSSSCLFHGVAVPSGLSVTDYMNNITEFKNDRKRNFLTCIQFSELMLFVLSIMQSMRIESDSIVDINEFMTNMDYRSKVVFANKMLKLYIQLMRCVYGVLDDDFLHHSALAFSTVSAFEQCT